MLGDHLGGKIVARTAVKSCVQACQAAWCFSGVPGLVRWTQLYQNGPVLPVVIQFEGLDQSLLILQKLKALGHVLLYSAFPHSWYNHDTEWCLIPCTHRHTVNNPLTVLHHLGMLDCADRDLGQYLRNRS